jgi:hypothetical protein
LPRPFDRVVDAAVLDEIEPSLNTYSISGTPTRRVLQAGAHAAPGAEVAQLAGGAALAVCSRKPPIVIVPAPA